MLARRCAIDAAGKATLYGAAIAALVSLIGAVLARYGKRDDTQVERARLAEERRQKDIDRLIENLQEEVAICKRDREAQGLVIRSHEDTIADLRLKYYDIYGDKQQLAGEVARLRERVKELERKVD